MKKMITKPFVNGFFSILSLGVLVFLSSCGGGGDDAKPKPTASFDYVADGAEVTFTNKSTNAKTYSWDFGDGSNSSEENPVHTYAEYGVYTVKLTATGDGGTTVSDPDILTLAKSSPVTIDGTFADWANIPVAVSSVDGDGGSLTSLKIDYDATKIYFYVTGDIHNSTRVFIDSDNNSATGTGADFDYLWKDSGLDYFFDTDHAETGGAQLFADQPAAGWGWDEVIAWANGPTFFLSGGVKDLDGKKAVEFSVLRSAIPDLSNGIIRLGVVDIETVNYTNTGGLPAFTTETTPGSTFSLDLSE